MRTIKSWFVLILGSVILLNLGVGYFVMSENGKLNDLMRSSPTKLIDSVQQASYLNELSSDIQYLDEVLTQSARNYAFTGNIVWKNRYNNEAPLLDSAIMDAIINGNQIDKTLFNDINSANIALVGMEAQSIALVDNGNKHGAQLVLDSAEYSKQKKVYSNGLDTFHKTKTMGADSAISTSLDELKTINNKIAKTNTTNGFFIGMLISIVALIAIILFLFINFLILRPILIIKKATKEIAKGHLYQQVNINSKNEIGDLANNFNIMAVKLKESNEDIENKIAGRTDELQKLNHFMTGRELKMIELKKQINDLEAKNETKK